MAETLGSLIDKLTIANIRLWHLEDDRRDYSKSDEKRLEAADSVSLVNKQRNNLIDEIDQFLERARRDLSMPVVQLKHKNYKESTDVSSE